MRIVNYDLDDILKLLLLAEYHEFGNDILYKTLLKSIDINKSYIDDFIKRNYSLELYTQEEIDKLNLVLVEIFKKFK